MSTSVGVSDALAERIRAAVPGAVVEWISNAASVGGGSLLVDRGHALQVARFLRDASDLRLDYCSNATGVDWLDRTERVKVRRTVDGVEREVEEVRVIPGFLEAVYHLGSMALRGGMVVLRLRTPDRSMDTVLPSLTPVWRSCELQEREIYDLFGIVFEGHPDLRRLMMWDGFQGHPMRKDYVEPDDYEYEPTAHDRVLERAKAHRADGEAG